MRRMLAQMRRIEPFFLRSRGLPRVGDRRVVSGIVYVIRNGTMRSTAVTVIISSPEIPRSWHKLS